jgi:NAD+ kinase
LEIISGSQQIVSVRLLKAQLYDSQGEKLGEEVAFNEFYALKSNILQTARIRVAVDNKVRFDPLVCDGVLVCTQAGSTAYNLSAGGEVMPIDYEGMVLTGICPQQQRYRWRSTILPKDAEVVFEAVDTEERPVVFVSDNKILPQVAKISVRYSNSPRAVVRLVFAKSQDFRERVLRLKFGSRGT